MELYDLKKDPHQVENLSKKVSSKVLVAQHRRLVDLALCSGNSCRDKPGVNAE